LGGLQKFPFSEPSPQCAFSLELERHIEVWRLT